MVIPFLWVMSSLSSGELKLNSSPFLDITFLILIYSFLFLALYLIKQDLSQIPSTTKEALLILPYSPSRRKKKTFILNGEKIIGRDKNCSIILEDSYASSQHARIYQKDNHFFIEDLESKNGTFLNGKRIKKETALKNGDKITIGKTELKFMEK